MAARNFDVVILGGGNAGMGVTVAPREAGLEVAMIEPDLLGGTCPNRGCMPKKVVVAAAHALGIPPESGSSCRPARKAYPSIVIYIISAAISRKRESFVSDDRAWIADQPGV